MGLGIEQTQKCFGHFEETHTTLHWRYYDNWTRTTTGL